MLNPNSLGSVATTEIGVVTVGLGTSRVDPFGPTWEPGGDPAVSKPAAGARALVFWFSE